MKWSVGLGCPPPYIICNNSITAQIKTNLRKVIESLINCEKRLDSLVEMSGKPLTFDFTCY